MLESYLDPAIDDDPARVDRALDEGRGSYYEDPVAAMAIATAAYELGQSLRDPGICARARALLTAVSVHRGDLRGALSLSMEAERHADAQEQPHVSAEVAAARSQVSFLTGSYGDAVAHAERAVVLADRTGDLNLRIFTRRATCLVFGNVGVPDLRERIETMLALSIRGGSRWEEAVSRNDLACYFQLSGQLDDAHAEIERALAAAEAVRTGNRFALGLIHSTRADILLGLGEPAPALADAERAIALFTSGPEPNPYVTAVTVRAEVQARMALGQFDDAQAAGEDALAWLGDRVPQTRSLILSTLATELRTAGRTEAAFDALTRSAEIEREAFRELSELRLSLERATIEASTTRRRNEALAARHRDLARVHSELVSRASELESLSDELREQADRDWLTGLYNRRYLAREVESSAGRLPVPLTLAVLDLDHFKAINDRFGHHTGDQVLVRVATLLFDELRETDILVRSGGEEFLIVMPATTSAAGISCFERILRAVEREPWHEIAAGLRITASAGLATTTEPPELATLTELADQRLYAAKREGRNRLTADAILE